MYEYLMFVRGAASAAEAAGIGFGRTGAGKTGVGIVMYVGDGARSTGRGPTCKVESGRTAGCGKKTCSSGTGAGRPVNVVGYPAETWKVWSGGGWSVWSGAGWSGWNMPPVYVAVVTGKFGGQLIGMFLTQFGGELAVLDGVRNGENSSGARAPSDLPLVGVHMLDGDFATGVFPGNSDVLISGAADAGVVNGRWGASIHAENSMNVFFTGMPAGGNCTAGEILTAGEGAGPTR